MSETLPVYAAAIFAGAMTLGTLVVVGGDDGKLDMISHASAIGVGAIAYRFGAWRKNHSQRKLISADESQSAAELVGTPHRFLESEQKS